MAHMNFKYLRNFNFTNIVMCHWNKFNVLIIILFIVKSNAVQIRVQNMYSKLVILFIFITCDYHFINLPKIK
jgi:hypothetical protein